MVKSRLKTKAETKTSTKKVSRPTARAKNLHSQQATPDAPEIAGWIQDALEGLQKKKFATQAEAVRAVATSVAARVTQDKNAKKATVEFLEMLIDTDPVLKEELIGCLQVKG